MDSGDAVRALLLMLADGVSAQSERERGVHRSGIEWLRGEEELG